MRQARLNFCLAIARERIDEGMRLRCDFVLEVRDQIGAMGRSELPHHDPPQPVVPGGSSFSKLGTRGFAA
jgi:hypothetical protein